MIQASAQPFMFSGPQLRPDWPFGTLAPAAYGLIMADPPWRFETWSAKGEGRSPQAHYRTMTLPQIERLPVWELAQPDCLLWLWACAPLLPQALEVMARWGFRFVTMGGWAKRTVHDKAAFGTGYVLRSSMEPFLIGKRGEPRTTRTVRNLISAPLREHSRKPEEGFAAAERLMPRASRLELFSRSDRPGWDAFGDEAGKYNDGTTAVSAQPRAERVPGEAGTSESLSVDPEAGRKRA